MKHVTFLKSKLNFLRFKSQKLHSNSRISNKFSYLVSFADFRSTKFTFAFASFFCAKHFHCFIL